MESRTRFTVLGCPAALVSGRVYNISGTSEHSTKTGLAGIIARKLPGVKVEVLEEKPDPRNYRISFEKAAGELGFSVQKTVPDGIDEILDATAKGVLNPADAKHSNLSAYLNSVRLF